VGISLHGDLDQPKTLEMVEVALRDVKLKPRHGTRYASST